MAPSQIRHDQDDRERAEFLIATGFLAIGPKTHDQSPRNRQQFMMDLADEQIDVTFQAFQGLTVACARCHDHKFDPIPQKDYYAVAGIFRSTETCYGTIRVFLNNYPSPTLSLSRDAGVPLHLEPLTPERRAGIERQIADTRSQMREITGQNAFLRRIFMQSRVSTLQSQLAQYDDDGTPRLKHFADDLEGVAISDFWHDIPPVSAQSTERVGYPTQKPEALLDRILRASSNEGDLVLDCFVGSGTTAAVAEKLGRRWIACDLGRFAIHTTRKRLLQIADVRPFVVQNLGKYERQLWQTGQFAREGPETPEQAAARHRAYVAFILQLYHATPLHGYTWLHGTKGGRLVHVGSVEAPVSVGDVKNIAAEFKKAIGTGKDAPQTNGVDVLGWDFAFELHEVASQQAAAANIRVQFKRIPRDVMDKRAVEQGDIHFFELAALGVTAKAKGKEVTLTLTDFVIPPDDVPEEVRAAVKHWSQWIDYWAVDWDHKDDPFHNQWQTFRTRKEGKLKLTAEHKYDEPGEYRVVVKVIDILGNDTTKTVKVRVK